MKQVKIIIVGNGERAGCYCKYAISDPDRLKIEAIVDPDERKLNEGKLLYGVPEDKLFRSVKDCVDYYDKNGKTADGVLNCTMDELHYETAMPFLERGYNMLIEKPVVNNLRDLLEIKRVAEKNECLLMVCHVLRYTPFYRGIKQVILNGEIGEIMHMETSENVGVAHSSNSYIRGKWNSREKCGSSMLLAKCCHDLDLLCWLNDKAVPTEAASFGGRDFIVPEKAPKNAGTRCLVDCPHVHDCIYSAESIYVKTDNYPYYSWTCINKDYRDITKEEKIESLKTYNPHGECAYKTNSDLVDHQTLILKFSNGSTATHSMIQGAVRACRLIRIVGTRGEIQGMIESSKFVVRKYDFDNASYVEEEHDVSSEIAASDHHAGGDDGIIRDFVNMISGGKTSISCTKIEDSIYGHLCVYKADEAMEKSKVEKIKIDGE